MIFYSLDFSAGDKILTCVSEYASNYLAYMQMAKRKGIIIEVVPDDEFGQISLIELQKRIDPSVKLIAITHVPTQGGLINPAEEVGKIANDANIFYLLDATQSVGQMPIDVKKIGCDALCATGRKFLRGPRGTGFLYINQNIVERLDPPFLDLHAAKFLNKDEYMIQPNAQRFETWETNYSNKIGLGVAIDYALELGLENIWSRIQYLADKLRYCLLSISGVRLTDLGENKCGIVTFYTKILPPRSVFYKLGDRKINVSVSTSEYAPIDMNARGLSSVVRASVHYYNTDEEIRELGEALEEILS